MSACQFGGYRVFRMANLFFFLRKKKIGSTTLKVKKDARTPPLPFVADRGSNGGCFAAAFKYRGAANLPWAGVVGGGGSEAEIWSLPGAAASIRAGPSSSQLPPFLLPHSTEGQQGHRSARKMPRCPRQKGQKCSWPPPASLGLRRPAGLRGLAAPCPPGPGGVCLQAAIW